LERHWRDLHTPLIAAAQEALNEVLPPDLVARNEERVYVEADESPVRQIARDVRVVESDANWAGSAAISAGTASPMLLDIDSEPVTERFIEIIESDGRRVITAIEFISPRNKVPGDGREAYLQKRREFLSSSTNLVEIDLVRGGDLDELLRPYRSPRTRPAYRACVRRVRRPEKLEYYPISLRDPLPTVSIPLRATDPDVALNLRALLDRAYRAGRYATTDYTHPCVPPLDA
ncbi:MAG: DUF4058 family protein, partial [Tepidisphaeraceae bacterium]